jgi:hypothetical protein
LGQVISQKHTRPIDLVNRSVQGLTTDFGKRRYQHLIIRTSRIYFLWSSTVTTATRGLPTLRHLCSSRPKCMGVNRYHAHHVGLDSGIISLHKHFDFLKPRSAGATRKSGTCMTTTGTGTIVFINTLLATRHQESSVIDLGAGSLLMLFGLPAKTLSSYYMIFLIFGLQQCDVHIIAALGSVGDSSAGHYFVFRFSRRPIN